MKLQNNKTNFNIKHNNSRPRCYIIRAFNKPLMNDKMNKQKRREAQTSHLPYRIIMITPEYLQDVHDG